MRRVAYAAVVLLAAVAATVVYWLSVLVIWLAVKAHKLNPEAKRGNCWMYALRQWHMRGGGLYVRPSGIKVGHFFAPHVAWVERLGSGAVVEQYTTDDPLPASNLSGVWFVGEVRRTETDAPIKEYT